MDNNRVNLVGQVISIDKKFEFRGIDFYKAIIKVDRFSGFSDYLPVTIPEYVLDGVGDLLWKTVGITGDLRSYNGLKTEPQKCYVTTYAKGIDVLENDSCHINDIAIDGYICREPVIRRTPLGKTITECCIAVSRKYGNTSYINCIACGSCAVKISGLSIGANMKISGRMQSREYMKYHDSGEPETKTAYELSVFDMEVPNAENI